MAGPYNLRTRPSSGLQTHRAERKAKRSRNPHLESKIGQEKIEYRKKVLPHLKHITNDQSNGLCTQAAAYEHARRTYKKPRISGACAAHAVFVEKRDERAGRKTGLRSMTRVGKKKGERRWERISGRQVRAE